MWIAEHDRNCGTYWCSEICFIGVWQIVGENKPLEAIVQSCYRQGLQLLIYKGVTLGLQNSGNPKVTDV